MESLLAKIFATALALSQVTTTPDAAKTQFDRTRDQEEVARLLGAGCTRMRKAFDIEDINLDELNATAMDDPQVMTSENEAFRGINFADLQTAYRQFCENEKVPATPTSAQAQWRRGWGWGLGGLALGWTIAAALSRPAYAYGYGYPAYSYGYGPAYGYGSSGYGAGPEGHASYGYGYPAYSYASYGYPGYGYGGGYYRPAYRPVYYGGYRPAYRPPSTEAIASPAALRSPRARWR